MPAGLRPEFQQRVEWKTRLVDWLLPRIAQPADRETTLELFLGALEQAHDDGLADAETVLRQLSEAEPDSRHLSIAHSAISRLRKLNASG
jgi:hypothetical protein